MGREPDEDGATGKRRSKASAATQPVTVEDAGAVLKGAAEELKLKLRGELLFTGGAAYEEARKIWNGAIDKRPALVSSAALGRRT